MLKRLTILAVLLTTMCPMPGQAVKDATQGSDKGEAHGEDNQVSTPKSPPLAGKAIQPATSKPDGGPIAGDDKEHSVKLTSLPPVTLTDKSKTVGDHILDWGPWIFNLGLVIVGALQVVLLIRTRDQIKRQAEIMDTSAADAKETGKHTETLAMQAVRQSDLTQRQFDLANRPWIAIDDVMVSSGLTFRADGCVEVHFRYKVRNVGHSVAQHVLPWVEPIVTGIDNPIEVRTRISAQLKQPVNSHFDHGQLIFPNQVLIGDYPILIRPEKLAQALDNSPFKGQDGSTIRGIGLEVFICFDYQSTLDTGKHYQTQSMHLISHNGMGLFVPTQFYGRGGLGLTFKGFGAYAD
jgi:hypothetical protein